MTIVIGLVIHASHRTIFEEAARTLSGVRLEWVTYRHENEIQPLVREFLGREQVDGLLLGKVPFAESRDLLPADVSVAVIKSAGLDLSIAFFRAAARGWRAAPVSIDTFDQETVDEVVQALQLDRSQVACLPYNPRQSVEEIVGFHRRFMEKTGAAYAISLRTAVTARLADSVPVVNALYGPATIRTNLHELALRIQSRQANASRFAAGVFRVVTQDAQADLDRARIGLMNLLVNTPEFGEAWIENRDRRGVVVFAHKALFEHATQNWISLPTLGEAQETLGIRLAAGFGIGVSARTCVQLAEWAAARAEQESIPSAYLVQDNGVIIGPMSSGSANPLAFTYRDHGGDIEGLARRVGLSPATLSRLAALERSLEGRLISPSDLAGSLGITDPSGRRLIRKLNESGLVTEEGSEQVHRKGRPTRLYRLGIGTALTDEATPS
ncbi:MarR family transcriptional regulator [Streptosporangium carneum]|uniref:Uncharacterized protein n=1 Tax=Streptosporangium carneum TaxID=47481 RepID=A0A9W6I635_9ACTN|nr:helix-turn-helix domain-containing protein [Streptosporangium carneum]GLK12797.1 hypothetical protein GCM10017600_62070 [Streptosporangium carneum]